MSDETPATESPESATSPETEAGPETAQSSKTRIELLEQEGEIAADYLEELLDIADLDGDLDMDVEGDRAAVSIVGADLSQLIGRNGEVLEALQELTRLAVYRETGERSRLMLDISGYRAKKRAQLEKLAELGLPFWLVEGHDWQLELGDRAPLHLELGALAGLRLFGTAAARERPRARPEGNHHVGHQVHPSSPGSTSTASRSIRARDTAIPARTARVSSVTTSGSRSRPRTPPSSSRANSGCSRAARAAWPSPCGRWSPRPR